MPEPASLRYLLVLGKYRVIDRQQTISGSRITVDLGGFKMKIDIPSHVDVRDGDLLTFYTEVPINTKRE